MASAQELSNHKPVDIFPLINMNFNMDIFNDRSI